MKIALNVGINDYPGTANDLSGCVNDAHDWRGYLKELGFSSDVLTDNLATRQNIRDAFRAMITTADSGIAVFTYSGHGTQVYDDSGDEEDGYDEALYTYDGVLTDDELRETIDNYLSPNVSLVVILDSCFSGTGTRIVNSKNHRVKYMPPEDLRITLKTPLKKAFLEESMPEILITGCSPTEYSYDAYLSGRWNGVFTKTALGILKDNPTLTYSQFYTLLRGELPSTQYPQTPMLEGMKKHKDSMMFVPFEEEPEPQPEPEPPVIPWYKKLWNTLFGWLWYWRKI